MNEKTVEKTDKKPAPPSPLAELPRGISVLELKFNKIIQVPGHQSTDTCSAKKLPNGCYWEIEFIPQIRHHKITYVDPSRKERCSTKFVHESRVDTWEPAGL
jgi:hypothetical protein